MEKRHFLILQVGVNNRPKYKQKRCLFGKDSVLIFYDLGQHLPDQHHIPLPPDLCTLIISRFRVPNIGTRILWTSAKGPIPTGSRVRIGVQHLSPSVVYLEQIECFYAAKYRHKYSIQSIRTKRRRDIQVSRYLVHIHHDAAIGKASNIVAYSYVIADVILRQ